MQTEGYSGADIHVACREASMMPMRRLIALMDPLEIHEMRRRGQLTIPKVCINYNKYNSTLMLFISVVVAVVAIVIAIM